MALRPKSKGLHIEPPQPEPVQDTAANIHYCQGHRFVKTPVGWRCDACQSPHFPGMERCDGFTN